MTTALTERPVLGVAEWGTIKEQANMLIKTGFLPPSIKTPEQVIAIALTGRELGIGMMESIRGINVIQGKPSVSPQLMLALSRRTGELEKFAVHAPGKPGVPPDHTGAECHVKRKGEPDHVTVFGPSEAKALGLAGKDNYSKQAPVMYQWRAVAANLRVTFPDAISGLYTPDELGADVTVDAEGEMHVKNPPPAPAVAMPKEKAVDAQVMLPADEQLPTTGPTISDGERKLLFKLARASWGEQADDNLRKFLRAKFNSDSTSTLTPAQFDEAVEELKQAALAAEAQKIG
jgi:hypothetical protein